jgi:hypothetical protein
MQWLWSLLGVLHARLASADLQLAIAKKFTDLIREDVIWCVLSAESAAQLQATCVDSWCDRMSQLISSLAVRLLHAACNVYRLQRCTTYTTDRVETEMIT